MAAITSAIVGLASAAVGLVGAKKQANAQRRAAREQTRAMQAQEEKARLIERNAAAEGSAAGTGARVKYGGATGADTIEAPTWERGTAKRQSALAGGAVSNAVWGGRRS